MKAQTEAEGGLGEGSRGEGGCIPKMFKREKQQKLVMDSLWGMRQGGGPGSDLGGVVDGDAIGQEREHRKRNRFGGMRVRVRACSRRGRQLVSQDVSVVGKPGWVLLPLASSSCPKAMRVSRVRSGEQGQYFSVQGLLTTPEC